MAITCPITVTVTAPAPPTPTGTPNITAFAVPFPPQSSYVFSPVAPLTYIDLPIGITFKNTGSASGNYAPKLIVNGATIDPDTGAGVRTLAAGASEILMFTIRVTSAGTLTICPSPNI